MKKLKENFEKLWIPVFVAMCTTMTLAENLSSEAKQTGLFKGIEIKTDTGASGGFLKMIGVLIGAIFSFIDNIKLVLLLLVIGGFIWSISGQIRGQQIDLTEIFKNLIIFGILGAIIWFGPSWLLSMFKNMGNGNGANINNEFVMKEIPQKVITNLNVDSSGNYVYLK